MQKLRCVFIKVVNQVQSYRFTVRLIITALLSAVITCLVAIYIEIYTSMVEFDLNIVHQIHNETDPILNSILKNVNAEAEFMEADKNILVKTIFRVVEVLKKNSDSLKAATIEIDRLKSVQLKNQETIIGLQDDDRHAERIVEAAKSEIRSYSDAVKRIREEGESYTLKRIETVVKTAVQAEERQKNVVLHGIPEDERKPLGTQVIDVLDKVSGQRSGIIQCSRIGHPQSIPGKSRPVKVSFKSREEAVFVLKNAKNLKGTQFGNVFISPDRTHEERMERQRLVTELRQRRASEPNNQHYISRGKVYSREQYH